MAIRNNYRGNNMIRTTQKVSTMIGSVGATGATGIMPGIPMRFNTATDNADHDAGDVWLDAAAGSEVLLGIDDVDINANNIVDRISIWDDSSTSALYGIVTIYQAADSSNWIQMKITAVLSDQSGWTNFTVVHISKGGTIANNDLVVLDFNRSGDRGATGDTGLTGGAITGLDYNFSTATADSDQGTGKVWLNHATRSSATVLYIDDNDNQSADLSAFIAVWDDGTTSADRGYLKIQQRADNGIWSIFKISGASVDATAYWKIAVTHIASAGSLTNTNPMDVFFTRSGNQGAGLASIVGDTTPQLGGFLDPNGKYIGMAKGGDISSASPLVIDVDGDYFVVTGTTNFAAMTVAAGRHFFLEFAGILTITHGAGTTDIPGGANYTSVAGDVIECFSTAANTVTIVGIELVSGKAQVESVTLANSVTLTNKSINLANNTVTMTAAQLNTAVSDGTVATAGFSVAMSIAL
jgi:hypothetical protein